MIEPAIEWPDARLLPPWQGIRYLRLLPGVGAAAAVVVVVLAESAAGLEPEHVRLHGPRELSYVVVFPCDEQGRRSASIELHLAERGGPGTYWVSLDGPAELALHPCFGLAELVFALECETGDPGSAALTAAREPSPEPELDLLSKDYEALVALQLDRLRVVAPERAEPSPASLERVLIELLAHHGDMLSYYQDRALEEAFLERARTRHAIAQHGRLLGYRIGEHVAARTILAFDVERPGVVPAGLEVCAPPRPDETEVVVATIADTPVEPGRSSAALMPAQWPGAHAARIPAGARSLVVLGHPPALVPGLELMLVQGELGHACRLTRIERSHRPGWVADPDAPLSTTAVAITRIHWDAPLEQALRMWDPDAPLRLHANLVHARHGRRVRAQLLPSGRRVLAREIIELRLDHRNAIVTREHESRWLLRALELPVAPVLYDLDDDGRSVAAVELEIDGQRWLAREHLHRSRGFDRHYVVSSDSSGRVWLQLGDDRHGAGLELEPHPDTGLVGARPKQTLDVVVRVGDPLVGNCSSARLTRILAPPPGSAAALGLAELGECRVCNVTPGHGGVRAESITSARLAIPESLHHGPLTRAVSLDDYARVAEQADAAVERATARALGGLFDTVLVLVDERGGRDGRTQLSDGVRARVEAALERLRMIGREVVVRGPDYVALDVELQVEAAPGYAARAVRERVLAELRPGSAARPGYFHPDRLSFGLALELGDLLAHVQGLAGVRAVEARRFRRLGQAGNAVVARIELRATEVARLDADRDVAHGRLLVRVTEPSRAQVLA